jgi:hypothetical protein
MNGSCLKIAQLDRLIDAPSRVRAGVLPLQAKDVEGSLKHRGTGAADGRWGAATAHTLNKNADRVRPGRVGLKNFSPGALRHLATRRGGTR